MNKKSTISVLLIVIIPILYFTFVAGLTDEEKTGSAILITPPQSSSKDFINCILNDGYDPARLPGYLLENNFGKYKELNFNAVHRYFGSDTTYGMFEQPLTTNQIDRTIKLYDSLTSKNLKGVLGIVNIQNFCNGQRLVYEAEGGNNGFSYQRRIAEGITDSGRTVLHTCIGNCDSTTRWLCDGIYENLQHTDGYTDFVVPGDRNGNWYLKPLMRIDSSVVDNTPEKLVIAIYVRNFRGDYIDTIVIRARNFKDNSGNYPGNYIQKYQMNQGLGDHLLQISGSDTDPNGLNYGVSRDWKKWEDSCKIDFKVWWFGQVDVWFDKMTVDDEMGNALLKGSYDAKIEEESTKESFASSIFSLRNMKNIRPSNYFAVNYVLNKMYNHLNPIEYAQAR